MLSKDKALKILSENISEENLRKHMIAVGAIMRELAKKFGEDELIWEVTGLLHDIDYEKTKENFDEHGLLSAKMLEGKLPEESLHAIMAHNERTGVEAKSKMDKSLLSADAISGLVVAASLVMPNKKVSEVKVKTLKEKFKDKSFARKIDRNRIKKCKEIGLDMEEFFDLSLRALLDVAGEIGL